MKSDCIFCKIANGEIPSATVYEDDQLRAILDVSPASKGHILIVPKEHFENIYDISEEVAQKVMRLAKKMGSAMKKALACDGLNVLQNNEAVAGQTVFHFHMHLIPRYQGDDVQIQWKSGILSQEDKESLIEKMQEEL